MPETNFAEFAAAGFDLAAIATSMQQKRRTGKQEETHERREPRRVTERAASYRDRASKRETRDGETRGRKSEPCGEEEDRRKRSSSPAAPAATIRRSARGLSPSPPRIPD